MENLISNIKSYNLDLKEAEIEGLLYLLLSENNLTNSGLIQLTGLPKETLRLFKNSISSLLDDSKDELVRLNDRGIDQISKIAPKPYFWSLLTYSEKDLVQRIVNIRSKYDLKPKREYDQFFATPETTINKAAILNKKGLISKKNILLIGDDDLVSISIALLNPNYSSITVIDIDPVILSTIETINKDLNLKNIQTRIFDVRRGVNSELPSNFDVILTDPPYTVNGISLFLNFSLQVLMGSKDLAGKYIALFYGNSFKSPEKTIKIQEVINRFNLIIEDKIDKFARYDGAESIGSASSLYLLKLSKYSEPSQNLQLVNEIYTFEDRQEDKFPFVDHYTFKLFKVPKYIVEVKKAMLKVAGDFCNLHRLTVVDTKVTEFKGKGMTITFVLSNSNLVFHTWPEFGAVHIDLITCSPIYKKELMTKNLSELFKTRNIETRRVE